MLTKQYPVPSRERRKKILNKRKNIKQNELKFKKEAPKAPQLLAVLQPLLLQFHHMPVALMVLWICSLPPTSPPRFTPWAPWPVAVLGQTPAMVLTGLRAVRVDGARHVGAWALARTFSLFFVVPALIMDRDGRGLHDRVSRTVVVRTR